ncbi:hypothetical protein ACFSJQ_12200 [Vibrio olivae]
MSLINLLAFLSVLFMDRVQAALQCLTRLGIQHTSSKSTAAGQLDGGAANLVVIFGVADLLVFLVAKLL